MKSKQSKATVDDGAYEKKQLEIKQRKELELRRKKDQEKAANTVKYDAKKIMSNTQ